MSDQSSFPPPAFPPPSPPAVRTTAGVAKSLKLFALFSIISLGLVMFTELYRYTLIDEALNGAGDVTSQELLSSDDYVATAWGLTLISIIVSSILLLVWINRTTKNVRAAGYATEKGSAWAVWSFFIPIANFWLVHGTLKDLAQGIRSTDSSKANLDATPLRRFWFFSIAGTLMNYVSGGFTTEGDDFDFSAYQSELGVTLVACALLIVSFVYSRKFFSNLAQ